MRTAGPELTPKARKLHKLYHPLTAGICSLKGDGQMDGEHEIQKAYQSILGHDFERAIEWFDRAIAMEPDNAAYHYKLSITYARNNKLSKSIQHATTAVQLEPTREDYQFHLQNLNARELIFQAGRCFEGEEEQLKQGIDLLKKAIVLDPLALEAYLILGAAHARLRDFPSAILATKEALRLDPNHEIAKQHLMNYHKQLNS
jgi:tetratricopeptide (TPR) repeat protein